MTTPYTPIYAGGTLPLASERVVGSTSLDADAPFLPETEDLGADEIRVTILGSGSPWVTRAQAGGSVLMEVGNERRDVFIFDLGSGALANFSGLRVPVTSLKNVLFSHLHSDHIADYITLIGSYAKQGRLDPLEVWGGGAENPELGMAAFVAAMDKAMAWNLESMRGFMPTSGAHASVHEVPFDRSQVIYQRNDATITSFPVVHGLSGAVGYRLDFAGQSVVFTGDTTPARTVIEASAGCDLLIHDTSLPAPVFAEVMRAPIEQAERIVNDGHTSARAAGAIFEMVGPRMAAMWHCQTVDGFIEPVFEEVAKNYGGPLVLCQDLTVFNVTADGIVARQAQTNAWPHKVVGASETERHLEEKPPRPAWWDAVSIDWRSLAGED